jgi:hypothetical protein
MMGPQTEIICFTARMPMSQRKYRLGYLHLHFLTMTMPMKISLLEELPTYCAKYQFHLAPKDGIL